MHFEISKPIKWLGFCVVALILGLLAVLYIDTNSELDIAGTRQIWPTRTHETTTTETNTSDSLAAKNWKTYIDTTYGISFRYPKEWPDAKSELVKKYPDSPSNIDYQQVYFGSGKDSKYIIRSVQISKFADYVDTPIASGAEKIKTVYSSKSAKGVEKLWLPPSNAAIMSANTPEYIETADKSFRGIYYFANIGQDRGTTLDCIVILTDGQEKIVQFHLAMASDKAAEYQRTITTDEGISNFVKYVKDIDANSTETIVKEFSSIYKLIAQSVQTATTDETANWKTYENSTYGFSLKYPASYTVTDSIPKIKKSQIGPEEGLIISDTTDSQSPTLKLYVDPSGWGPFFPEVTYDLSKSGKGISISKEVKNTTDENSNDGQTLLYCKPIDLSNASFWFMFSSKEGNKDYGDTFKTILSTFAVSN